MMRYKQSMLEGYTPVKEYDTVINGNSVHIQVYKEPKYCVNVIKGKDRHCYPLSEEQFKHYTLSYNECIKKHDEFIAKATDCYHKGNPELAKFYYNAAKGYKQRGLNNSIWNM